MTIRNSTFLEFSDPIGRKALLVWITNNSITARNLIDNKQQLKPWESLIISENLSWDQFLVINNYLYELIGVKPVMTISRNYPFDEIYTHVPPIAAAIGSSIN